MQKYMINGSTGADVRSFLPRFIIPPVYDNLNDAKQHAINLVTKDLHKFEKIETGFEIKTNDLSWEIIDKDGVIWEHVYIQKNRLVDGYNKDETLDKTAGNSCAETKD